MAENKTTTPALPAITPMVVKTYRVDEGDHKDAEFAARSLYKKELSVMIREFVQKLAKKKQ